MTTIKAIQTRYAGCHFRSRLEARWAVALDHLGITWEYEPQGVMVTDRLTDPNNEDGRPYLPDFWLPNHGLWAEVKGHLTHDELRDLLNAAASLSSNDGGGCHDAGGNDLILLGPIPRPSPWGTLPIRLHLHKGDLIATPWDGGDRFPIWCGDGITVARDSGEVFPDRDLTHGFPGTVSPAVQSAYTAARSARFEHGQNGPTP